MNTHLRLLAVASSFAFMSAGAFAQSTNTGPSATPSTESAKQADRDYEGAKAACQKERSKTLRTECMRRAEDAHDKATGMTGTALGGMGGSASGTASGGGSNSAKQRS